MNSRSVCIGILYICGSSLLISSVLSCSGKHKGDGWSSGYDYKDYKADFSHLDNLDASAHPTLSEKIKWVLKDHYNKHGKHPKEIKGHHGHSGGFGSDGYGYGAGGGGGGGSGGHYHHGGVAWSPPKHNNPIVIHQGGISHGHSQQSYQEHHNNHHDENAHNEGDDEVGHDEIDHTNNANDNHAYQHHQAQEDNKGHHQWSSPAHSYQYAAHNSHLVPLAVRPNVVGSKDFMPKLRYLLGLKTYGQE